MTSGTAMRRVRDPRRSAGLWERRSLRLRQRCLLRCLPFRTLLGATRVHRVVSSRRNVFSQLPAHRANVSDDLLNLVVGNLLAKRRHTIRTALDDRRVDVFRVFTIDPFFIHQWWSNSATTVEVTSGAVVLRVKPLAFIGFVGAFLRRVLHRLLRPGRSRMNIAHRHVVRLETWRRLAELSLFAFARRDEQAQTHTKEQLSKHPWLLSPDRLVELCSL